MDAQMLNLRALGHARQSLAYRFSLLTGPVRRLPDFLIVGAQKSGTTSLYHYLSAHRLVMPAATKEIHFFNSNYHRGLSWYRSHFPLNRPAKITGEATPG